MTDSPDMLDRVKAQSYWYHRITLPNDIVTPGWSPICADRYAIPDDLTGKRVLDIGAWDGYWTWEALKRGAKEVIAIDDFSDTLGTGVTHPKWTTFDICREAFGFTTDLDKGLYQGCWWSNDNGQVVKRHKWSVYDIAPDAEIFGHFDIVFCFGTLYHLKYPLLALEKIASVCDGELYIESAICDDYSPYRGGLNRGYPNNNMVTEFYPGAQYGGNTSNWWVPTLQCLGEMVKSVGFTSIQAWPLMDEPKELSQCRGFVYGSKTGIVNAKAETFATVGVKPSLSVSAVMSIPRLGFHDNMFCVFEGLVPLKIPLTKVQGAFWGQCLERGIQQQIDLGFDAILTIDYDTMFTMEDVKELIRLMAEHPEADAIVPLQVGRGSMRALMTLKTRTGQVRDFVDREEFRPELLKIATGHFGLTLLRTSSLLKLPHPWFYGHPAPDGQWGIGRIDDDIHFWKQMEAAGMTVYSANHVVLGHLQLVATWPDEDLNPLYSVPQEFYDKGKPVNCWK